MKITIDENRRTQPETMIIGVCGEIASRTIEVVSPDIDGATLYVMRFELPSGIVYETGVNGNAVVIPAAVLAEAGCGRMQWIARNSTGQLIAKSSIIGYAVMQSLGDETSTLPAPEDTESAIERINKAVEEGLEQFAGLGFVDGNIQEVIDARTGSIVQNTFTSLSQRLNADFGTCITQGELENALSSVTTAYTNADNEVKESVEAVRTVAMANQTDVSALKESVSNLQDEDVAISRNIATVNATATTAHNKADACLEQMHSHDNKEILDSITADTLVTLTFTQQQAQGNSAQISSLSDGLTTVSNKANEALNKANACLDAAHGHGNKNVLDTITSDTIATIEAVRTVAMANQTDVSALKESVSNLQDEDVAISRNIATVNATATMAHNKADDALTKIAESSALARSTIGIPFKRNLLKNTASSTTKYGVTFTVGDDGSVTVNGTATADAELIVRNMTLNANTNYILSGCPASEGSGWQYRIYAMNTSTWAIVGADYGRGSGYTLSTGNNAGWSFRIQIKSGYTADNLVFYPMLRYAEIINDTYEPYTPSLQEQINTLASAVQALGGATSTTEV